MAGFNIDLQFHPYQKRNYVLSDVLKEMERKNLDGLAFLYYDWEKDVSLALVDEITANIKKDYIVEKDKNVISFINKKGGAVLSIILGQEVGSQNQKWHVLSIGATGIKSVNLEDIVEEILGKGGIVIIDHPFADPPKKFQDIGPEKETELINLCLKYREKIALEWNGYCLPQIRRLLPGYGDCNQKTKELAEEFGIPLIPTSDLHAKNKKSLEEMGNSLIEIPKESVNLENLLNSLKENISAFNFKPQFGYVSLRHFIWNYGFPLFMKK